MSVIPQYFATLRNVSLGYPARRINVNPGTKSHFTSLEEAQEFAENFSEESPWEYELTYGVEYLLSGS